MDSMPSMPLVYMYLAWGCGMRLLHLYVLIVLGICRAGVLVWRWGAPSLAGEVVDQTTPASHRFRSLGRTSYTLGLRPRHSTLSIPQQAIPTRRGEEDLALTLTNSSCRRYELNV